MPTILDLELAQFLTPQRVEQQGGKNGTVALALDGVFVGGGQQLACLMIADGWRLAFAAFCPRPLNALDRIMGDGVFLAQIFEQRGERCQPVPDRGTAKPAPRQLVAPRDDVGARHGAEFFRPDDAGEQHEIPDRVFVDAAGVQVAEISEPLHLGRHVGQPVDPSSTVGCSGCGLSH
jgi:hypothetical protein